MKLDELDIPEASPIELLKRKLSPALHADQYEKAADTMYNVLQRKREENNGKFRHGLGYYAQQIGRSFNKVDYRALMNVFSKKYADEFPELVSELKIVKPDAKDTMGIRRAEMPQVATKDYPEFIDYLKDNGAHFTKDTVSPDSLKAIQGEFSDQGIEKALMKQHIKKPSIVSSDNYIIDGHHRWLAAMNTGQKVDIFRVDKPGKELLQLVKDFPKTTYKDIYTEAKVKEGAEITMWTNPEYQGSDVDDEYYNKQPAKLIDVNKLTPFEPADKMDDEISAANMGKLVTAIQAGEKINPVVITKHQGKWLIIDGHHRYFAHLKAGVDKIRVVVADPKDLTWRDDVPIDEELTVKQSHIFKVVSNLADRKDNRPFPIKFYDGGTLEVQPSTAKRIIDFYYQANDALQTKLLKFLPTYNGFKEIAKAAGAVQESAGVGKITKQNSTPDVKPGETERQAKKFFGGNGKPKPLGVKGATPHQAFNLGMTENMSVTGTERGKTARKKKLRPGSEEWFKHWFSLPLMKRESFEQAKAEMLEYAKQYMQEGYRLQLERGTDMDVLHIVDTKSGKRTEVRGKTGYESGNYDPEDRLHKLLDKIGKAANISELINGEPVGINPNHPDGASAKKDTDVAFNESTDLDSLRKFVRSQREAPDQVLYQMMMAPDTYGHEASNFVRSWYEKTKEENGLNDVDSALEIMVDELGLKSVQENFKDGKDYMHGYCHVWALKDIQKHPERKIYARVGYHYDDDSEEVDHIFTVDTETGKAYDVRGEFNSIDALLADYEYGADEVDVQEITRADIDDLCRSGELKPLDENFKDGKKPGRKGLSKRMGVDCSKPVGELRKIAKNSSGEKQRMAHWCANMKSGRK